MKQNSSTQLTIDSCPPTAAKPFVGGSTVKLVNFKFKIK